MPYKDKERQKEYLRTYYLYRQTQKLEWRELAERASDELATLRVQYATLKEAYDTLKAAYDGLLRAERKGM